MNRKRILSNIALIGLVSFFVDMSTEMVYPLIPLYLTTVLGATPVAVGIIEGIAESAASLLKAMSGYLGDRRENKKVLMLAGYSASVAYKILLLISASWPGILVARVVDRVGKGIRTAPRDALVAESSNSGKLGGSFGLHKALDMGGSALGALLAYLFVATGFGFRPAFLFSILPAAAGIAIIPAVREQKAEPEAVRPARAKSAMPGGILRAYLFIIFLFCLGNSSNAFLLLRAEDLGFSASETVLLYFGFNLSASLLSIPFGRLSDRLGRSRILVPGYLIYGLVYFAFAFVSYKGAVPLLFLAYGAYTALISGAERAFVAENAPEGYKGTALGIYGMLQGIGLLFASLLAGLLWDRFSPSAPFILGGVLGCVSALLIGILLGRRQNKNSTAA
ncbi:MFS transporter [Papillibacter cinnamivorans]|nr:MFS transporter [Papillibacter cinnamivorans]